MGRSIWSSTIPCIPRLRLAPRVTTCAERAAPATPFRPHLRACTVAYPPSSFRDEERMIHMNCANFARIVATMVRHSDVDFVFGCGVGGHRQGFSRENMKAKYFLAVPFGQDVLVAEIDNYIAVYGLQPPPCTLLHGFPEKYEVPGTDRDVDAVITRFDVWCPGTDGAPQPVAPPRHKAQPRRGKPDNAARDVYRSAPTQRDPTRASCVEP